MTTPESITTYEDVFHAEMEKESLERRIQAVEFLVFRHHLIALGKVRDTEPDIVEGQTRISVPRYFRHVQDESKEGSSPVNETALSLLIPAVDYGSVDSVNERGLLEIMQLPDDMVDAARQGKGVHLVIKKALGLDNVNATQTYDTLLRESRMIIPYETKEINKIVGGISWEHDDRAVGEVPEIATMIKENGYVDFLDYLVDVKQQLGQKVGEIATTAIERQREV